MKKLIKTISATLVCAMAIFCLTACVPGSVEKADAKLSDLGYVTDVNYVSAADFTSRFLGYNVDGITSGAKKLTASKDGYDITVFYFENKADAERFFDVYVLTKRDSYYWENIDQKGKVVMYGDNKAYEDFTK